LAGAPATVLPEPERIAADQYGHLAEMPLRDRARAMADASDGSLFGRIMTSGTAANREGAFV
jgi:hypothetical protein